MRFEKKRYSHRVTEFYWVLLGFTGFYWVLLGFTEFYWVLLGFSGFYGALRFERNATAAG